MYVFVYLVKFEQLSGHLLRKGKSRQIIRKWRDQKEIPTPKNRAGKKTKLSIRYQYKKHIVSRVNSYFPNRWPNQLPKVN